MCRFALFFLTLAVCAVASPASLPKSVQFPCAPGDGNDVEFAITPQGLAAAWADGAAAMRWPFDAPGAWDLLALVSIACLAWLLVLLRRDRARLPRAAATCANPAALPH